MGKVVEKKKKKKGRPSLLDLQKRSLRQQQKHQEQNQQKQNPYSNNFRNPNPNPNPDPNRRFTRQNPVSGGVTNGEEEAEDEEDDESNGKRRKKKLKLVLRLPPSRLSNPSSSPVSQHLRNSGSCGSDSNGEDEDGETPLKKRKIDTVFDRSAPSDEDLNAGSAKEKLERKNSASKVTDPLPGMPSESTPLPDKKLLVFILDRLQKKDTYGVFSDPVDPNELPDYHEVIEHPMDFSTVRKKLSKGAYADLEQFEKDVYLISSNAMRYNAPDTIYFRQARSILELAKKDFENLRQDSEDNEPEPRSVRRGRPPKNSIKKSFGRSDLAASDFTSDATLATGGDNTIWPNSSHDLLRKATGSDKLSTVDGSTRGSQGSRPTETHGNWLHEEFPASTLKGMPMRYGKKQFVFDENRRSTYKQSNHLVSGREPSVLATFDGERKQLTTVGLHMEHAYARSLARFAANLGPTAWKLTSKKIERVLPPGTKFGPGWVGEYEAPPQPPLLSFSSQPPQPPQPVSQQHPSQPKAQSFTSMPRTLEVKGEELSEKLESQGQPSTTPHPPSSASVSNRSSDPTGGEAVRGLNYGSVFGLLNSGSGIRPNPPFQFHTNPAMHSTVNGFNGGFGFNLQSHGGKSAGPARLPGKFGSSMPVNRLETENANMLVSSNSINSGNLLPDSGREGQTGWGTGPHPQVSRRGLSLHPKSDSVPPDLNVRFQSPGSPVSGVMVDSQQPDLALQL